MSDLFDDIDNLDHDPALAVALGNMLIAWAKAETALSHALAAITGMPINMALLGFYRIPTFEARTKTIMGMMAEWTDPRKAAADDHIARLSKLSGYRNSLVHGVWSKRRETDELVVFNLRTSDEPGKRQKPVKAHDVETHTAKVRETAAALLELFPRPQKWVSSPS